MKDVSWDDLKTVMVLVAQRSLAAAGAELGVNYTTVARRVARAEAALRTRLFERLADGYEPTEAARLVAAHAAGMASGQEALMRRLAGMDATLEGTLTITAPQLLVAYVLSPALARFRAMYPLVDLRVRATNDILDLSRREADLGIRVSRSPGDALTGLRLSAQHAASFASPGWAARIADDPGQPIDWILYEAHADVPKAARLAYPGSRVQYRFDDMIAMAGAAQAGLGVVQMPMFLGRSLPGLVQVPLVPPQPYMDLWMVAHPDIWPGAKVKAFRDVLKAEIRARRSLFVA